MRFNINKSISQTNMSARVMQVMKDFDMSYEHAKENFAGDIDIDDREWSIGLIVGGEVEQESQQSQKNSLQRDM